MRAYPRISNFLQLFESESTTCLNINSEIFERISKYFKFMFSGNSVELLLENFALELKSVRGKLRFKKMSSFTSIARILQNAAIDQKITVEV